MKNSKIPKNFRHAMVSLQKYEELEKELAQWVKEQREKQLRVKRKNVFEKAKKIAQEKNMTNFRGSTGWMTRFMKRENLSWRTRTHVGQKLPKDLEDKVSHSA